VCMDHRQFKERMEYLALIAEIESLKAELAALKPKAKPIKQPCPHATSKGEICKKYCAPGLNTCMVHSRPPKVKPPPREKPKKVNCTGVNLRGNACKRRCVPGESFCERHDPSLPPKEVKNKKKNKKVVPEHNHGIGEVPSVPCKLCDTHGDIFDMGVTDVVWVETSLS